LDICLLDLFVAQEKSSETMAMQTFELLMLKLKSRIRFNCEKQKGKRTSLKRCNSINKEKRQNKTKKKMKYAWQTLYSSL
jgi:hypothetical protein